MYAELLIIGGGPAGLAAAEGYRDEGGAGPVILLSDDVDAPYQRPPLSKGWLRDQGVRLVTGSPVARIDGGRTVVPEAGDPLTVDLVVVGAGIAPHVELAEAAELATRGGRVVTDDRLASSAAGIFATGDIALARNILARNIAAGRHLRVEHWGEAENMGEIAGRNAAGGAATWAVAPGFRSEIGADTLKYVAWGDGYDATRLVGRGGGFTDYYGRDGEVVGVLTYQADYDYDYEAGAALVEGHAAFADVVPA